MNDTITTHEAILDYMANKGYYCAYDLHEQYQVDMKATDTSLKLAENMK